jgi:two-component sensor histidine kinase
MLQPADKKEIETSDRRSWSIKSYLNAVSFASTFPIALVAGLLAYNLLENAAQKTRSEVEDRVRLLRSAIELRIANVIEDLEVLTRSPALQKNNLSEFREHAIEVVNVIGAIGIVLVEPDGQQIMSTRQAIGAVLPKRASLETQNRALQTGTLQVSNLVHSAADGQPIISVEAPVRISGQARYVLAIGLSSKYLSDVMKEAVPAQMIGSIIDRQGILISRWPLLDGADLVGKPTIPEVRERIGQSSAFWIKTISRTGEPYYSSFLRSNQTGWSINVALPREMVDGPFRRNILRFVAVVITTGFISLLFTRLVAARLISALASLEQQVVRLGEAKPIDPALGAVAEINRMQYVLRDVGGNIATAEEAIERERSLLEATVQTMPIGVLLVTPEGRISLVNRKMLEIWKLDDKRSIHDQNELLWQHLDGTPYQQSEWPVIQAIRFGKHIVGQEALSKVDGKICNVVINAVPVRDGMGRIIGAVSACYDVTDLRQAMNRQQILLDEINHRVKNTLAAVQSVARLSVLSATTINEYIVAFEQRLFALSAAYNLLTENNWEGVNLRTIVEQILAPYADAERVKIDGPVITLSPKLALAVAAAVQELATNAAKYGALSSARGRIEIWWAYQDDNYITFRWIETGGPLVHIPTRRGFGSKFIQEALAADTGWKVEVQYLPQGARCTFVIAL